LNQFICKLFLKLELKALEMFGDSANEANTSFQ